MNSSAIPRQNGGPFKACPEPVEGPDNDGEATAGRWPAHI